MSQIDTLTIAPRSLHQTIRNQVFPCDTNNFYLVVWFKIFLSTACLNICETHVTANNSANNNGAFFFASDLKIVHYNNY